MIFFMPGCLTSLAVLILSIVVVRHYNGGSLGFGGTILSMAIAVAVLIIMGRIRRRLWMARQKARLEEMRRRFSSGPQQADLMQQAWEAGDRNAALSVATARICAYVAGADGVFNQAELQTIIRVFATAGANPALIHVLTMDMMWFRMSPNIAPVCDLINRATTHEGQRRHIFQIAIAVAAADGVLSPNEKRALEHIAQLLGLDSSVVEEAIRVEFGTRTWQSRAYQAGSRPRRPSDVPIEDHYRTLGLQPGASMEEVKTKYRELAKKYHPDMAANMGEEFKTMAQQKFKAIQAAYEALKKQAL